MFGAIITTTIWIQSNLISSVALMTTPFQRRQSRGLILETPACRSSCASQQTISPWPLSSARAFPPTLTLELYSPARKISPATNSTAKRNTRKPSATNSIRKALNGLYTASWNLAPNTHTHTHHCKPCVSSSCPQAPLGGLFFVKDLGIYCRVS